MKITNRKAYFDAQILENFEAGINLLGSEVKAVRLGHADLSGSFVKIVGSEAYLFNSKIFPYEYARPDNYNPTRTRKLLLHKAEIIALRSKMDGQNLTIVPISLYTSRHRIKVELALAKSKKKADKRKVLKEETIKRDIEQALKNVH
ncbi:MAG TPA: SsrA-binding protein SmpB [Methylomirabilota bacterium]|nr:SsrA-binding protein SmpB [Methylomirabilota bacterium]